MGSHRVGHDEAMKRLNSSSSSKARNLVLCVISPDFDVFTERHLGMNEEDKRQVLSLGCRFAAGASSKEPACQSRRLREASVMPGPGRSPGGGRATHSSALAWRTPWTEEPGGLRSVGSHRVGHD